MGNAVPQELPPSVEYSKVLPVGHELAGAERTPPEGVPPNIEQELSESITIGGAAAVNAGQGGQVPGVVEIELDGEAVVPSSSHRHLVNTVIEEV